MTKGEIDRLGDRLRAGDPDAATLRALDDYRQSFADPYEDVVRVIREELRLEPTGRPSKSTTSIIDKLHRESVRLSQVQDIAGCRLIVPDIVAQARAVDQLKRAFDQAEIVDRRERSSHGYRAVHVIVLRLGRRIEVQVRTALQHLWAELSEKLSDRVDPKIKYGGGPQSLGNKLRAISDIVAVLEEREQQGPGWQPSSATLLAEARDMIARAIQKLIESPDKM